MLLGLLRHLLLLTHTPPVTTCLLAFTGSCSIKQAHEETFLQIRNTYLWEPSLIAIFTYFPAVRIRKEVQIGLWEPPTTIQNYTGQLFWFQKSPGPKMLDDDWLFQCWKTAKDNFTLQKVGIVKCIYNLVKQHDFNFWGKKYNLYILYCKIVVSVINSCQRAHSSPCLLKVAAWCRGHTPGWSQRNPL